MLIKKPTDIPASETTPESIYSARSEFMRGSLGLAAGVAPELLVASK